MRKSTVIASLAVTGLLVATAQASAVPSFTRQTGMTCNQCHVSFGGPVPNFTMTGKRFKINGYRMPMIGEKIEAGEPDGATGRRLNIPLVPYLSFRYQSVFAAQSKAPGADTASSITSNPTNRLSFFPGGAFGDNLGLWIELYLTPDGSPTREWSLGLFSFDEFDLRYVKMAGNNTFGLSFSNQSIKELGGFGPWPTVASNMTRGGFAGWSHPNRGNLYAYGLINDRLFLTIGASPGEDNLSWDKRNYQAQAAYAIMNTDASELWVNVASQFGNDGIPIVTNVAPAANRTWNYSDIIPTPTGQTMGPISALRNAGQRTPYRATDVGDYVRIEPEVRYGFVDKGAHSMETMIRYVMARETYSDNAEAKQDALAGGFRYMYNRTIGGDLLVSHNMNFDYISPTGVEYEIGTTTSWTGYLKYQPAMNFILNLSFGNAFTNVITPVAQRAQEVNIPRGWSWSLSTDILF
jgi:hypothetical protein